MSTTEPEVLDDLDAKMRELVGSGYDALSEEMQAGILGAIAYAVARWEGGGGGGGGSTTAEALGTTGSDVSVGTASPPTAGQVLTATSATAAAWQTPATPPSASSSVTSETSYGGAASAGSASTYARGDHTHGTPPLSSAIPAALGSASAGAATAPSRADHVHPMPTAADVGAYYAGGTDVPIADGGTGASTASAAFDALAPATTDEDLVVRRGGTNIRLAAPASSERASRVLGFSAGEIAWVLMPVIGVLGTGHQYSIDACSVATVVGDVEVL